MSDLGVGLIGTGFVADLHARGLAGAARARVLAAAGSSLDKARGFADTHGIPDAYGDYRELLARADIDLVCVGTPNDTHREIVLDAAAAGKHVVCEKPLARTLADADAMIAAASQATVKLMYAEVVCFAPKYVRAKQLIDEGALGRVFHVRHCEAHSGPHTDWFWRGQRSGGGVMMDMGCHSLELIRWLYGKPEVEYVSAELGTFVHGERTDLDDHALVTLRFTGDRVGVLETSWAKPGGMDDRLEVIGSGGTCYADLMRGSSLLAYSEAGYGYAVEKASTTKGWTFPIADESWEYGMPHQLAHFVDCVLSDRAPRESGEDGRAVLELIYAAYRSAATGERVHLPLELTPQQAAGAPCEAWLR
jgi:predicted dehydrogenase